MKKVIGFVGLALLMCGFTSCLSSKVTADVAAEYAYAAETMTPENSVVLIASFPGALNGEVVQEKPNAGTDVQKLTDEFFVSKPVKPGSQYGLKNLDWRANNGSVTRLGSTMISRGADRGFIEDVDCLNIKVPNKPGIYFVGTYLTWDLAEATSKTEAIEYKDQEYWINKEGDKINKSLISVYKKALPYYTGTTWETYILSEIERLGK